MNKRKIALAISLITSILAFCFLYNNYRINSINQNFLTHPHEESTSKKEESTSENIGSHRVVSMTNFAEKNGGKAMPVSVHAFFACSKINISRDSWDGFVIIYNDTCDCKRIYDSSHKQNLGKIESGESLKANVSFSSDSLR